MPPPFASSTSPDSNIRVPVGPSLAKRFYEPILLLKALNTTCARKPFHTPDQVYDMTQSPEHAFQYFVNSLAQLCDTKRGGDTVTAFVVLQHPDHIEYRFTSNRRETTEFILAQEFTTSILRILGNIRRYRINDAISNILLISLSFCRPRVTAYMDGLKVRVGECISECEAENTDESRAILEKLQHLYEGPLAYNQKELSNDDFAMNSKCLIISLSQLHQSRVNEFICDRTKEGRYHESEKWSELRHRTVRLLSYLRIAKSFVKVPKRWPELFDTPTVCFISSSDPDAFPLKGKRSPERTTASAIIGRMTSDVSEQEEYKTYANELQRIGLDGFLQRQPKFQPIVHAEVLLLDSLERDGGTHQSKFFNAYKYIGCSKPTCRLCCHFFSVHPSRVEVRRPHHNLYLPWRTPDIFEHQGKKADNERRDLMNKVLSYVRTDAFRVLREKLSEGRPHDSSLNSNYLRGSIIGGNAAEMENLTSSLNDLDMHGSTRVGSGYGGSDEKEISSITKASSLSEADDFLFEDDFEEDGGVKLL